MEKQVDLSGKVKEKKVAVEREEESLMKSALQKCIRQGLVEPSMYWALRLAESNWWICWKRLSTIAVEDCGQPEAILSLGELYRMFMTAKRRAKKGELSWDMKRAVVCAAKILAESPKDRTCDEFLEVVDAIEKNPESDLLKPVREVFETVPDEAFDMHTIQGRKMGRGLLYWYEKSSRCENMTPQYREWREWWQPLMIKLVKEVKKK